MSKKNDDDRFDVIYENVGWHHTNKIIVDKQTGVQYFYSGTSNGGGITPLLDKEGKVVINLGSVEVK
ncbi:xylan 1,4-beta-xylosidase [Romboutsia weinsteinii]|uniref:Xylan 1,4-beta-xylosidase n=1 Tax=Romboutsia weinsteinii TaxID=2020949 RepID=A0A371J0K3_9FIRM|nr:DUF6440 family protein [Romboutsia weinsteinii]RDY26255.1 xylan 1,4-beta-xylosidase [Romboutsia weinsteinii]